MYKISLLITLIILVIFINKYVVDLAYSTKTFLDHEKVVLGGIFELLIFASIIILLNTKQ